MSNLFHVRLTNFANVLEFKDVWGKNDYISLLDVMEYGDTSGLNAEELCEMCIMSLQDQDHAEAAYLVLKYRMSDILKEGQLRNLSEEMIDEKLWEEYADVALHERFFNIGSLLYKISPTIFPKPDAVAISVEITAENPDAMKMLSNPLSESFLVRLLADGMDKKAALHRLYDEQLSGKSFPDADKIVWTVEQFPRKPDKILVEVTSSGYWLDALESTRSYPSRAYADDPVSG